MPGRMISTSLICLMSLAALPARAQSVQTNEVTSGACMVICDDVSFCRGLDYDSGSGTCSIFINPADSGYVRLRNACPQVSPERWVISNSNGQWAIDCPQGSTGPIPQAPPPSGDPMTGLDDPQ